MPLLELLSTSFTSEEMTNIEHIVNNFLPETHKMVEVYFKTHPLESDDHSIIDRYLKNAETTLNTLQGNASSEEAVLQRTQNLVSKYTLINQITGEYNKVVQQRSQSSNSELAKTKELFANLKFFVGEQQQVNAECNQAKAEILAAQVESRSSLIKKSIR